MPAVYLAVFLLARVWFDLVSLAWLGLVVFLVPELCFWHFLISMSCFLAPAKLPWHRAVRIAFVLSATTILFSNPLVPNWLEGLYRTYWK